MIIVYGGEHMPYADPYATPTILTDTWAWGGTAWELLSDVGVGARTHFGLAYDSNARIGTLFGRYGGGAWLGDTWEYR